MAKHFEFFSVPNNITLVDPSKKKVLPHYLDTESRGCNGLVAKEESGMHTNTRFDQYHLFPVRLEKRRGRGNAKTVVDAIKLVVSLRCLDCCEQKSWLAHTVEISPMNTPWRT